MPRFLTRKRSFGTLPPASCRAGRPAGRCGTRKNPLRDWLRHEQCGSPRCSLKTEALGDDPLATGPPAPSKLTRPTAGGHTPQGETAPVRTRAVSTYPREVEEVSSLRTRRHQRRGYKNLNLLIRNRPVRGACCSPRPSVTLIPVFPQPNVRQWHQEPA